MAGGPGYRHPRGLSQPILVLQSSHEPTAQPWVPPCPRTDPQGYPRAPVQSSCWHHLQRMWGPSPMGVTPVKPPRCSRPLPLPSPHRRLPRSCPGGSARCRGERGGPWFPPEPPPPSLPRAAASPRGAPWGGPRCAPAPSPCQHVCQPVPAPPPLPPARPHPPLPQPWCRGQRRVPSLSPPRCPVRGAGQGSGQSQPAPGQVILRPLQPCPTGRAAGGLGVTGPATPSPHPWLCFVTAQNASFYTKPASGP